MRLLVLFTSLIRIVRLSETEYKAMRFRLRAVHSVSGGDGLSKTISLSTLARNGAAYICRRTRNGFWKRSGVNWSTWAREEGARQRVS